MPECILPPRRHSPRVFSLLLLSLEQPASTAIYPLSLHDALPISRSRPDRQTCGPEERRFRSAASRDRKSTRLNSSHLVISYAVFCLKKKNPTLKQSGKITAITT